MSEAGYVLWFIAQTVLTVAIITVCVFASADVFNHRHRRTPHKSRAESKQYWPHVRSH